jgi:hypothetical protein
MRKGVLVLVVLVTGMLPVVGFADPASAADLIIEVTTFTDQLNGQTGGTSLREAVSGAASDGQPTSIVVPSGEYLLNRCDTVPSDEDVGNTGDLDHLGNALDLHMIRRRGDEGTVVIRQTCAGSRILETPGAVSFEGYELAGGTSADDGGAVLSTGGVTLVDTDVTGNTTSGSGGGIFTTGEVVMDRSSVSFNQADDDGGGIQATEFVELTDSEVMRNQAGGDGGGILGLGDGDIGLIRSTVGLNTAGDGGGIFLDASSVVMEDATVAQNLGSDAFAVGGIFANDQVIAEGSTIADNLGGSSGTGNVDTGTFNAGETVITDDNTARPSCNVGTGVSEGFNYEQGGATCEVASNNGVVNGADPGLLPLAANGGPTQTAYLQKTSPLINRAPTSAVVCSGLGTDQRGITRPQGGTCDTGAVEVAPCGTIFGDVGGTHPFCYEIGWMSGAGITTGFAGSPPTYQPGSAVTRQSMSAFLYRLAGSPPFVAPGNPTFGDVGATHPFFDEIEWMAFEQISLGTAAVPKPLYKPSAAVSRGSMSAFMFRMATGELFAPFPISPTFSDVSPSHPFYGEVAWMAERGITTGFPGNLFKPGAAVTRQSMSAFMFRLAPVLTPIL